MVIDNGVCGQVPSWTSEPINVEAAEPGENLNLNRSGEAFTIESHDQKADLRTKQDHKAEEKTEAEKESVHGAHHAVWSLKPNHPLQPPSNFPCGLGFARRLV